MAFQTSQPDAATRSALSVALLLLLLGSAAAALVVQPRVIVAARSGNLNAEWLLVAPGVFALFILLSAADTVFRARQRGFVSGRSLAQLAFAVAFIGFLVPQAWTEYRARKAPPHDSAQLLRALSNHRDPRVRALVMDLAGFRGENNEVSAVLGSGLDDRDPMVKEAAVISVERREGLKLSDEDAADAKAIVRDWGTDAQAP